MVVAKQLHERLRAEAVASFVKTSGKTGLHVLVPWVYRGGYAEARDWARQRAKAVVAELPEVATLTAGKVHRRGKVYVDVLQNARGHHAVRSYTARGAAGLRLDPIGMGMSYTALTSPSLYAPDDV